MTNHVKGDRAELLQQAIRLKRAAARSRTPQMSLRPMGEAAHLGELQRSLWLLQQLEPESPAYNLVSAFRVMGLIDVLRLERSLNDVLSRHRLLRSTFRADRNRVLQIVSPVAEVSIEQMDVEPDEAVETAVREARVPFDLETGPLIRLLLIEEASGSQRLLVLVLHHILADERSLGFFWQELAEVYDGRAFDATQQPQYDDYVHWLAGRETQQPAELANWLERLDPLPEDLMLPFERPAGTEPLAVELQAVEDLAGGRSSRGRLLSRRLGADVRQQIRSVAAATGTTPFVVCAFAFRLLLHRYSDGRNIAFATPVSQRSHPATAKMIGYFLNPVVICTAIDEERSVEDSIGDFSRRMRDVLAQAAVPFDVLVEELSPPRQRDRHPIFQTMFVYQEAPPPPELGGVRLEPASLDLGESKFDLTLFVSDVASASYSDGTRSIEIAVEYRADRFDTAWMDQLLDHYETLIGHLGKDLGRPTAAVPMLRRGESEHRLAAAQGPPLETQDLALLPQQTLEQTRQSQQALAVTCGEEEWSYAELERAASSIAGELMRRGVQPGDRVGLFLDRSPRMIAGLLGCHWAGAAYVPLDPAYPSARNRDVLEDAEVSAVLTGPGQNRSALLDLLATGSIPTIDIDDLEMDGAEDWALPDLRADHPAYLLYTSGSTGRPKGVVVTHANLRASNGARLQYYARPVQRFLLLPSVAFDSSVAGIFGTLAAGGALVIPTGDKAQDPRRLAQLIIGKKVTSLLCVPSLYAHILTAGKDRLRQLETVIVAGESCPRQLVAEHFRWLPKARLFNEYGPTEATVWATVHEIEHQEADSTDRGPIAIGRPIPGVRVEVLDAMGRRVPAGIPGQGWIAGPTVAQGYWRNQALTDERFIQRSLEGVGEDRMYRTGDRLSWTVDGRLLFLGRMDEQIKLRGFRIEPGEIEAALLKFPEVEGAAVVARDAAQLVAFFERANGEGANVERAHVETGNVETADAVVDWRQELAQRLPEYMVPSRLVELGQLPRLPNGKVDRGQLREMPLSPSGPRSTSLVSADEEPLVVDEREQTLVALWEGLLGRTGIGPRDNFFQLGGHSLLVVEMASAIERDLGVALAPAEVFQNPTIEQLAQRIEAQAGPGTPAYSHLFPIQPGGYGAPFIFSVPHFFSAVVANRFRGERPVYGLRGVSLRAEGNRGRWPTMGDLGEDLVREVRHRFPDTTSIMVGYSFGATMAVEAVRLMEESGIAVQRLYLIAPMPVDFFRLGPFRVQIDNLRHGVEELSLQQALWRFAGDSHPFTRRPYQRLWRLLAIQPWRRLLCWIGRLRALVGLPLTAKILHADVRLERFRLHAQYRPGILRTPTVIFNAKEPATDAAATWRPYFEGPFTVHEIPDPHLGEANVQAAQELILRHLDALGGT